MKNIFGPINSRRFGTSLGVDLSATTKQCNYDCLYCELAPAKTTQTQTVSISVDEIISELQEHLNEKIDVITLTANGEPTLYPYLDELIEKIDSIKNQTQTLILTNSATLIDEKVFNTLLKLDQVKLSLDSVSEDIFKKIDRPHDAIKLSAILDALERFSKLFTGKLFIEILVVKTLNDKEDEVLKLSEYLLRLKNIQRVDLGTIDRPPAYGVEAVSFEKLHSMALLFDTTLPIHIASRSKGKNIASSYSEEEIVFTLSKRPLTQNDIEVLFDENSKKILKKLENEKIVFQKEMGGLSFYVVKK
jgi:wyosine [tRNA(Phe)-imidazoG37] synthetase (radical SAM superfamily)